MSSRDPLRATQWRLTWRFSALVAVLLLAGGGGVYAYVRHALLSAFDAGHDLAIQSARESIDATGPAVSVNARELAEELAELSQTLGVVAAIVFDHEGRTVAGASLGPQVRPRGPAREVEGVGDATIVLRRVPLGSTGATLVVARRAGDVGRALATLTRALAMLLPAVALAALFAGWMMAERSLRPVRRALERQRAFMADASHELRTPLAVIRAQADVALDGDRDAESLRAALAVVARTSEQAGELVGDLSLLAQIDEAPGTANRVVTRFDDLVEESVDAFAAMAAQAGFRLRFTPPTQAFDVDGDPAQLKRLVAVLIDNALHHADAGDVDVHLARSGGWIELHVDDGGPGIDASQVPRLFERFAQGEAAAGRQRGSGLGLSIARAIAVAHGGTLSLGPNDRRGTRATTRVPASRSRSRSPS